MKRLFLLQGLFFSILCCAVEPKIATAPLPLCFKEFFKQSYSHEGFCADTLVKTVCGYKPIKDLVEGEIVIACNDQDKFPKKDDEPEKDPGDKQRAFKTTKEATEAAKKLNFEKTNYHSQGQPVFKKGNRYITPDVTCHNGGVWKMADSVENLGSKTTRMGTYDAYLTRIGD